MAFKDLREFLDGPLELPVGGKVYIVPKLSAEAGIQLEIEMDKPQPTETPSTAETLESYRPLLGDILDVMLADKLTPTEIVRCALTVRVDDMLGREAAEEFFGLGDIPKALQARAAKAAGQATRRSTRTAAGTTTTGRGTTSSTRRNGRTTSTK